jgi:hypothetical protein
VSKKPQRPMNRAKPTKKATPTSKREGDKPIVEPLRVLVNGNSDAQRSAICRQFVLDTGSGFHH